jgi:integrase
MASIFKRNADKGRRGSTYYISYTDADGKWRTRKGFPDKAATETLARHLETEARLRRMGVIDPKVDRQLQAENRPLEDHLADYHSALTAKGDTAKHAGQTRTYARKVITLTKAERISDLAISGVQEAVGTLRAGGSSLRTCNAYLRAIKGFSRWLYRDSRTREDTLAHLEGYNALTDRRRERRAFTVKELVQLAEAAERGQVVLGMTGPDRAMLYRLAVGTGFRAGELRSLTPESFHLEGVQPTVTVAAAYSKRRRDDAQPIRPQLADILRPWLLGKAPHRPVFDLPEKTAKMLRNDLEAAGIAYRDASGQVADFHAFRHTYVTMVLGSGTSIKAAQELARHSTPTLTIGLYAHARPEERAAALSSIPCLADQNSTPNAGQVAAPAQVTEENAEGAASAQRSCGEARRDGANSGGIAATEAVCFKRRKPRRKKGLGTARRNLAASGESAPRRTRTYNPLIKSRQVPSQDTGRKHAAYQDL